MLPSFGIIRGKIVKKSRKNKTALIVVPEYVAGTVLVPTIIGYDYKKN